MVVDVVGKPHAHATLVRADERVLDDLPGLVLEPDVVEREVERLARRVQELGHLVGDVDRALTAVAVEADLQHYLAARSDAL